MDQGNICDYFNILDHNSSVTVHKKMQIFVFVVIVKGTCTRVELNDLRHVLYPTKTHKLTNTFYSMSNHINAEKVSIKYSEITTYHGAD